MNSLVEISVRAAMSSPWMVHGREKPQKPEWRKGLQQLEAGVYKPYSFLPPAEGLCILGPQDGNLLIFYLTGYGVYANRRAIKKDLFELAKAQGLRDVVGFAGNQARVRYYTRWGKTTVETSPDETLVRLHNG